MGTTPIYAIPYVESTGKLAEYPAADKAQAEAVEAALGGKYAPYRMAAGSSLLSASQVGNTGITLAIAYPAGRFTQLPVVVGSADSNGYGFGMATGTTLTGCSLRYYNPTASTHSNAKVAWIAVQMTAASAPGLLAEAAGSESVVTCHTEGCDNAGIPIPLRLTEIDAAGVTQQIANVACGVCSQPITDIKR